MFPSAKRVLAILLVVGFGASVQSGPLMASDAQDHERARRALEAGEVMPLRAIIEVVERDHPGQIVELELERDHGRWLYEIKLLRPDGSLAKLEVDARDGRVLSIRGRDADGHKTSEKVR